MFTLQILDRGQTFLYSPPDHPVTLGSGADADLRLDEAGVVGAHARIEPGDGGLRLVGLGPLRVNGVDVERADLQLGDRIEIGRAVLVVGQSVARAASPEDVLDSPRLRTGRRADVKRSKLPLALGAVLVFAMAALAFLNNGDEGAVRGEFAAIGKARDNGDFARGRSLIAQARIDWVGAVDDRLQRLDASERELLAIEAAMADLEARVLEPTSGTYAFWITELRRLEDAGAAADQLAARFVRSTLRETLQRRPDRPAGSIQPEQLAETGNPPPPPPTPGDVEEPEVDRAADALADADRLSAQGLFAQAIANLNSELGEAVDASDVTRLQQRLTSLRTEALAAARKLVGEARTQVDSGRPGAAITLIALAQHRFPGSGEFAILTETLRGIEQAEAKAAVAAARQQTAGSGDVAAPGAAVSPAPSQPDAGAGGATRMATLSALRTQLDQIRDAEAAGDYVTAERLLHEAAGLARDRDADFAERLESRAADAAVRTALHAAATAALGAGRKLRVMLREGGDAELTAVEGARFQTTQAGRHVGWNDFSASGIAAIVEQVGVTGDAALGAAMMIYAMGDQVLAETLLAQALRSDAKLKPAIDRVVAQGRSDRFGGRGYVLGKDGFVSVHRIESEKQAKRIARRIDGVFRNRDTNARAEFVTELLAAGPNELDAVVMAFEADLQKTRQKLETGALRKQIDRLEQQRVLLDAARKNAKDLIYDEVEYFYPYKPPAVSSDRFAEYNRVQAEVNRRIATVTSIWNDRRERVKVPAALRADIERLDWAANVLADLGAFDPNDTADLEWVRALPTGAAITIAEYCRTIAERDELAQWQRIEKYNSIAVREMSSAVRELLRITNGYREMYRHRPLAIAAVVCNAAQGHAEEMSKLGYFSHTSPTPGRRTPFDRMRLAGYNYGVSENIATNSSALGAHHAWLGSSGHHRNMLNPRHQEIGVGADGRNWVQNFGGGATYKDQSAWQQAVKASR